MKVELDNELDEYKKTEKPLRHFVKLDLEQFNYNDHLCDLAEVERIKPFVKAGYIKKRANNKEFREDYRDVLIKYDEL